MSGTLSTYCGIEPEFGHLVKADRNGGWMKGPEEKRTNLGVWSEVSGPIGYRAKMFMKVAGRLSGLSD